jgi:uncharacterized protein YuzE
MERAARDQLPARFGGREVADNSVHMPPKLAELRVQARPYGGHEIMKVTYDSEVDVLRVLFSAAQITESDEDKPGVILDYDEAGNVVGLEILNASQRVDNPRAMDFAMTA